VDFSKIITIQPGKRSGQPCIRGMRITVKDVLEYLAGGMTVEEVLEEFRDLTPEDIRACFAWAAEQEGLRMEEAETLSSEDEELLKTRLDDFEASPEGGAPWEEVEARIRARLAGQ